jgi:hypothetical protein
MRLTVQSLYPGMAAIVADGMDVGTVARLHGTVPPGEVWEALLDDVPGGRIAERVYRPTLGAMRAELRRRITEDGPWWGAA